MGIAGQLHDHDQLIGVFLASFAQDLSRLPALLIADGLGYGYLWNFCESVAIAATAPPFEYRSRNGKNTLAAPSA